MHKRVLIAEDHPCFAGHFPGHPIVPGVLLLDEVVVLAESMGQVKGITQAKFLAPVLPGQSVDIDLEPSGKFTMRVAEVLVASGQLQLTQASATPVLGHA
ncbi:MAG: hypothetical protein RLZZ502_744 [Pseudomonadota bacterium]